MEKSSFPMEQVGKGITRWEKRRCKGRRPPGMFQKLYWFYIAGVQNERRLRGGKRGSRVCSVNKSYHGHRIPRSKLWMYLEDWGYLWNHVRLWRGGPVEVGEAVPWMTYWRVWELPNWSPLQWSWTRLSECELARCLQNWSSRVYLSSVQRDQSFVKYEKRGDRWEELGIWKKKLVSH